MGFDFHIFLPKGKLKYGFDIHGFSTEFRTYNSVNSPIEQNETLQNFLHISIISTPAQDLLLNPELEFKNIH